MGAYPSNFSLYKGIIQNSGRFGRFAPKILKGGEKIGGKPIKNELPE